MIQQDLLSYVPPPPKEILGDRFGETFHAPIDRKPLNQMAQIVWDAMADEKWYSIPELKAKILATTGKSYSETGISARTRDFRQPCYGCTRETMESVRVKGQLWRYRLHPEKRLGA